MEKSARPIIIVRKKISHGGHHGGAWKVAYADFVTAMIALFIVLWLLNTSKPVKDAVAGYFKDPSGSSNKVGTNLVGSGEDFNLTKDNMEQLKEELQKSIRQVSDFDKLKNQIEITITSEGLRIELLETESGTFFDSGSARPSQQSERLLSFLAAELGKLPNKVSIEGHTDSKPYTSIHDYGNWELSADRANAARRLMQQDGLGQNQVSQVRGFADQKLRKADHPLDASNRRITLIVQYIVKDVGKDSSPTDSSAGTKPAAGKAKESKAEH